jgi:hypothetical protein
MVMGVMYRKVRRGTPRRLEEREQLTAKLGERREVSLGTKEQSLHELAVCHNTRF